MTPMTVAGVVFLTASWSSVVPVVGWWALMSAPDLGEKKKKKEFWNCL
jgi:hypothetical protein